MHAKYQVSICNGSKVMANVKVVLKQTNNVTNKQTNRRGKNNMPPRSYLGGIKKYWSVPYFSFEQTRPCVTYIQSFKKIERDHENPP